MNQQYHLPLPQREAMTAADFMVTSSNREAAQWTLERTPAAWPSHCLILYGPHGCGKTHLLTAWSEKYGAHILEAGENILPDIVNQTNDKERWNSLPPEGRVRGGGGNWEEASALMMRTGSQKSPS
jgi:chromosomal replication initiation ATPase DnaA